MRRALFFAVLGLSVCGSSPVASADRLGDLRRQLQARAAEEQIQAVQAVGELGPLAAALVPDLIPLLDHAALVVRHEAVIALGEIGSAAEEAVPALVRLLQGDSVILKHSALQTLRQIGPAAKSAWPHVERFLAAEERLLSVPAAAACLTIEGSASPQGTRAIRILVEALGDERAHIRTDAAQALAWAGAAAVEPLSRVLRSKAASDPTRIVACEALALIGPEAQLATPALIALGTSSNTEVLVAVAEALGSISAEDPSALTLLSQLAKHSEPRVRAAAVSAIGAFGEKASAQVGLLAESLRDEQVLVRQAAAEALAVLGPAAREAIPALDAALADAQGTVTIRAAEALVQIGSAAVPVVVKRLRDASYAPLALEILRRMGPEATSATSDLVRLLAEPGMLPLQEICLTLSAIQPDPQTAGPALIKLARDAADRTVQAAAIYALGRIEDRQALNVVTQAVESEEPLVRLAAAWALVQFDPHNPDYVKIAVPRLTAALERPEPRIRLQAARTLGRLGAAARTAIPALQKRVAEDPELEVRIAAAAALAESGADAAPCVPCLLELFNEPQADARRTVLYALGRIGPPAREAIPLLRREVQQGPAADRALAAWALLQVQPDQKYLEEALPPLLKALPREQPEAVVEMVQVLGRVGKGRADVRAALEALLTAEERQVRDAARAALEQLR